MQNIEQMKKMTENSLIVDEIHEHHEHSIYSFILITTTLKINDHYNLR